MISNSEVSFCVDTLLVETILADPKFYKKANFVQDLLGKAKDYFSHQIDPKNPVKSVLDILAPGALWLLFQSFGIGKWGFLLGLLMDVFHVDVSGMLTSLYGKVKEMISGGKKVSSAEVDAAAEATTQQYNQAPTPEEESKGLQDLKQRQQGQQAPAEAQADDKKIYSSLELLSDARIFRLALIEYENQAMRLTKDPVVKMAGFFGNTKSKGTNLLGKVFGWVIKLALASAGLMVAGDVANEVMGRPSALSGTYQRGQESSESAPAPPSGPKATQTKFPPKGDSPLPSSMPVVNNPQNIENMVVQFTKDVYNGLDGKEGLIRNSPAFQAVKDNIVWYNTHNEGSSITFIPGLFTSKKQLVDYFIDDVAKSAP
jgi:hypothetical protein